MKFINTLLVCKLSLKTGLNLMSYKKYVKVKNHQDAKVVSYASERDGAVSDDDSGYVKSAKILPKYDATKNVWDLSFSFDYGNKTLRGGDLWSFMGDHSFRITFDYPSAETVMTGSLDEIVGQDVDLSKKQTFDLNVVLKSNRESIIIAKYQIIIEDSKIKNVPVSLENVTPALN